ncbi:BRI1 kinase inhibitor 1 [Hibiscus trionum]|uniref:BRI1 kinase inhibitor 1 n=1 Tax=Hibiscus trionum TaxID=183268 RepID=A0A9W7MG15_HIBTR|nr:BRI1 kinase inhibitor 1 [Hibiscus trionum]
MEKVEGKNDKQQSSMVVSSSASSPPSASSSPSHEFSFTISLHSSSNTVSDKTKSLPSSIAVDLTPADDIFFHGHLLPLHLLSHLPVSPRSSTTSLDSFRLPVREVLDDPKPEKTSKSDSNIRSMNGRPVNNNMESKAREKSKSFSLFSFTRRPKGRVDVVEHKDKHKKKKMRFDVSHLLKRYVKMVRPLLFFRGKRDKLHVQRQAYSFSGNLGSLRNKKEDELMRGRRGEYYSSAPASMRTSPTNSGLLVATTAFPSSTSDSTMEELQAAIQAAIAHCKNSIRGEDNKLKC